MPSQYDKMAHLLRRAGFGARPDQINNYLNQGFEATVDQLVNYEQIADPTVPLLPTTRDGGFDIKVLSADDIGTWWIERMIKTTHPLEERMVIFWHDHFATSVTKINPPNGFKYLYWQNQVFRQYATGNFRDLCKAVNRDPAMLWWLDNIYNIKGSPNENYARELMEIFMLGLDAFFAGAYTEPDVQQAARAFTGWGIRRGNDQPLSDTDLNGPLTDPTQAIEIPPTVPDNSRPSQRHDYGDKTVFGIVQNFNGDDIVNTILDHEPQRSNAARMLGKKVFEHFAYENPEAYVVDHLAAVLLRNNFSTKALLRDLFLNTKEFYSEKALYSVLKWPIHYVVMAIRLLQAQVSTRDINGFGRRASSAYSIAAMGQQLLNPPDVFGWPGREEWSTTSQLLARANWANSLTSNRSSVVGNNGIPIDTVLATGNLGGNATAEQVVDYFTSLIVQAPLAANVRQGLVDYLRKADNGSIGNFVLDSATKDKKIRGLIHLLLARPETQSL
ncbi:MAG: DUF1800 domain-containing protein [Acidobacteriota bacterium]